MAKFYTKNVNEATNECIQTKSFSVFYSIEEEQVKNLHNHDCCEILLCMSNNHEFIIGDTVAQADKFDLFVLNQFEMHGLIDKNDSFCERYVFKVHPQFLLYHSTKTTDLSSCFYKLGPSNRKIKLTQQGANELANILNRFKKDGEYGDDIINTSWALAFIIKVNKYLLENKNSESQSKTKKTKFVGKTLYNMNESNLVYRVITFINENLTEDINLDIIAKKQYICKNHLCRIFKKQTGTTVVQYLILRRIGEAKKYLSQGYEIKKVCELCGFKEYSNFIRSFKKVVGESPKKYVVKK